MRCFARWEKDKRTELFFRDQTILQFGDSWNLLANLILLNPGSAEPENEQSQNELLKSKKLAFFVEPKDGENYLKFKPDPLMKDIIKLFANSFSGGCIQIYNLFNLKNQNSKEAIFEFLDNKSHPKIFTHKNAINFCNVPVIVASGSNAKKYPDLKNKLIQYIKLADQEKIYKLAKDKNDHKKFLFVKAKPDISGFIDSYHPSYTFKYGNSTHIGELKI